MSAKTYDEALDFMPTAITGGRGPFSTIRSLIQAIAEGRAAQLRYDHNCAHGMVPSEAASLAFSQKLASN